MKRIALFASADPQQLGIRLFSGGYLSDWVAVVWAADNL